MKISAKNPSLRLANQQFELVNGNAVPKKLPSLANAESPAKPSGILRDIRQLHGISNQVTSSIGRIEQYIHTMYALFEKAASGNTSAAELPALDRQFQSMITRINREANRSINGFGALNGTGQVDAAARESLKPFLFDNKLNQPQASEALLRPNALNVSGLFGATTMSLLNRDSIGDVFEALQSARQSIRGAQEEVAGFKAALVYAGNNVRGRQNTQPAFHEIAFADKASEVVGATYGQVDVLNHTLDRALELVRQSAETSSDTERSFKEQELQHLLRHANLVVANGKSPDGSHLFGGEYLLDLTPALERFVVTGAENQPTADQARLMMPSLTTETLFNGAQPSIATYEASIQALELITQAKKRLSHAQSEVMDFAKALQFARNNMGLGNTPQSFNNVQLITGTLTPIPSAPPPFNIPAEQSFGNVQLITGILTPTPTLANPIVPVTQGNLGTEKVAVVTGILTGINILI